MNKLRGVYLTVSGWMVYKGMNIYGPYKTREEALASSPGRS